MPANISIPKTQSAGLKASIADWALDKGLSFVFNKWLKGPLANHKTTIGGVGAVLHGLLLVVNVILDWTNGAPVQVKDLGAGIAEIVIGFGLFAARDFDKTSKGELAVVDGHVIPKALPVE
jgi:hypothetical protein